MIGTLLALIGLVVAPSASAADPCPRPVTTNYLASLAGMPNLHRVPASGELPFGPPALRLTPVAGLRPGGGGVGFTLGSVNAKALGRLQWRLAFSITKVSGRTGSPIGKTTLVLSRVNTARSLWAHPLRLMTSLPSRPAYYRLRLTFANKDGRVLGRFGEYVRTVKRRLKVRLAIKPEVVHPGQVIASRLLNRGTLPISFGPALTLEQHTESGWVIPPGPEKYWPPVGVILSAGSAWRCQSIRLSSSLPAGTYRLSKAIAGGGASFSVHGLFKIEGS